MASNHREALNLGRDEMVSINHLVDIICDIAGKKLTKEHDLTKPQGVRGRNSDNTLLRKVLGWEPEMTLEKGLAITYKWIEGEVKKKEVGELAEVTGD
jgi:GDP-D-mannose 3',5'-epimerase